MLAAILELEPGAGDEITRRRGHEPLARSRAASDARTDMHRDAARLLAARTFDLASVHARAHLEAELTQRVADLERAADRARRPVKERQEAITGRINFLAAKALEFAPHLRVMLLEQLAPGAVAKLAHPLGRADEVGDEDRGEDSLRERRRPHTRQELLDFVDGVRDKPGQVLMVRSRGEPGARNPGGDVRALAGERLGVEDKGPGSTAAQGARRYRCCS